MNSQALSLYNLTEEHAGVFSFVSDQNFTFNLSFQIANENDGFADYSNIREKLLIVTFRPIPKINIREIKDPKIEHTICHFLKKALDNDFILNYLCSDDEGYERHRRIIFGMWYSQLESKDEYLKIDYTLEEPSGKKTYLGFLIKKNHTLLDDFLKSVNAEVDRYQQEK